ncbi:MAG: EF-P lysine aminoacylase EpmA [Acidobacteriota bacterium]
MSRLASGAWRPTASLAALRRRAALLARLRAFFAARGVLEVETPLLAASTVPDLHLASVRCRLELPGAPSGRGDLFLQTSPEAHMKRLLAAGSGPIYQICRVVRDGEAGRRHNPEFTMLEWYRPAFDHHALMDEMDALLADVLGAVPAERLTVAAAFARVGVDPHRDDLDALRRRAAALGLDAPSLDDRDDLLHLILSHTVEPDLGRGNGDTVRPTFLYDYPASQAALARVRPADPARDTPAVAERFEVYIDGVELANGFHELTDAAEQRRRFEADRAERARRGLPVPPLDEHLLAALEHGLPPSAGVALGVDRLVLVAAGGGALADVLAFPIDRA